MRTTRKAASTPAQMRKLAAKIRRNSVKLSAKLRAVKREVRSSKVSDR